MRIHKNKVFKYENEEVFEYTLDNEIGLKVSILNLGATITKILTKDKLENWENIILSYDNIEEYKVNSSYYGATIGRTSGRIFNGNFILNHNTYNLNKNYGTNQGHGGQEGFNKKLWSVEEKISENEIGLELTYLSKDGEEGYPGNLNIKVKYIVTKENELKFLVEGISDKETLLNITNHSYFNLSGDYKEDVLNHTLKMNCDRLVEIEETSAPTGKILDCTKGPFNFIEGKKIGQDIYCDDKQIKLGYGYDHPFLFKDNEEGKVILTHEGSGRYMEITTSYPGVVVYSQNFIDNKKLLNGKEVERRMGICLEIQNPPIGHNECFKEYSSVKENKVYKHKTIYKFGIK